MARKAQKLINYHTTGTTMPAFADVNPGEIVVRHNETKPELLIKVGEESFATFIASGAVHTAITAATNTVNNRVTNLSGATKNITDALDTKITNVQNSVTATTGAVQTAIDAAFDSAKTYTDTEVAEVNAVVTGHTQSIAGLQSATGTLNSTLATTTGRVNTLSSTTINLQTQVTAAQGAADAAQADVDALSGVTSAFSASVATQLNGKVATSTFTSATGTLNSNITRVSGWVVANEAVLDTQTGRIDGLSGVVATITGSSHSHTNKTVLDGIDATDIQHWDLAFGSAHTHSNKGVLDAITQGNVNNWNSAEADAVASAKGYTDAKVATLTGSDTGKTIREIANEELAAQLIPSGAQDSLDTLQEIADWIQSHPDDAAAMNSKITELSGVTEDIQSSLAGYATTGTVNGINTRLQTAEGEIDALQSATGTLNTSITGVGSRVTSLSGVVSAFSATVVTQLNTKVATSTFTAATGSLSSQISSVDAKFAGYATTAITNGLDTRLDAAEGSISSLEEQLGTLEGSSHSHGNKGVLDTITSATVSRANAAVTAATVANQASVGVVASVATNTLTLNFDDLIIDCGEF